MEPEELIPPMYETTGKLAKALAKAQGEMRGAIKGTPGHYGEYADYEAVAATVRKPLSANGLSYSHCFIATNLPPNVRLIVRTWLLHESGERLLSDYPVGSEVKGDQKLGSSISYGKRYTLEAITGCARDGEDDDAEAADPDSKTNRAVEAVVKATGGKVVGQIKKTITKAQWDTLWTLIVAKADGEMDEANLQQRRILAKLGVKKPNQIPGSEYKALCGEFAAAEKAAGGKK